MNQSLDPRQIKIAFIQACWHAEIVTSCRQGFLTELTHQGCEENIVDVFDVPGAFDIPLLAKKLALQGRYDAIVASGFVVNGGIYRHDFVATTVIEGLMQVQLETGVPVISAVLTPHQFQEHDPHKTFFSEHFVLKGREAADACLTIVANFDRLAASSAGACPGSQMSRTAEDIHQ